ncbi:hypothetical protein ACU686_02110 [Yinghuangia aomiensis]
MTAADGHPLLRYADPPTRAAAATRLDLPQPPPPEPPAGHAPGDVIARLRSGRGKDPRYVLDGVVVTDWDLITAEHRRAPFPDVIGAGLVARPDCPAHAALALVTAHSTSRRGHGTATLAAALQRGVVTPHQVLHEATPAWSAVRVLERYATTYGKWLLPIGLLFADAAALLPGDDADAWQRLVTVGPYFPGTFPDLCAAVGDPATTPAIEPAPGRPVHWEFTSPAGLLRHAPPRVADRIVRNAPVAMLSTFAQMPALPASLIVPALRAAPALAKTLVPQLAQTPRDLRRMLAHPDPAVVGLVLAEFPRWGPAPQDDGTSPEDVVAALRAEPPGADVRVPASAWPAVETAHARDPFPDHTLVRLANRPECPESLVLAACHAIPAAAEILGGRGRPYALTALRHPCTSPPGAGRRRRPPGTSPRWPGRRSPRPNSSTSPTPPPGPSTPSPTHTPCSPRSTPKPPYTCTPCSRASPGTWKPG